MYTYIYIYICIYTPSAPMLPASCPTVFAAVVVHKFLSPDNDIYALPLLQLLLGSPLETLGQRWCIYI